MPTTSPFTANSESAHQPISHRNKPNAIVVLTGAGISAESGINTFRASDGLWENHRIEDVATLEGFQRNPQLVYKFYNQRRQHLLSPQVRPNAAHIALAKFAHQFKGEFTLITQNVDNLHERAGSERVIHMHGELLKMRCINSERVFDTTLQLNFDSECRCCGGTGNLRPHIVWFGEMPLSMQEINLALSNCDLFLAIGTSANVYPAAGFYQQAKAAKAHTVQLNLEATDALFDQEIFGPATTIVPTYLEKLLSQ